MVVYTLFTCATAATRWRASSATPRVWASVAPGGSSRYTLGLRVVVWRDEARGQQRDECEQTHKERNGGGEGDPAVLDAPRGPAQVGAHPARVVVGADDGLQDVRRHHGREHPRHHQAGKHGERRRPAKLLEELARNAARQCGGQNTAISVKVVATTARPISSAASIAAW